MPVVWPDADEFERRAGDLLAAREAAHNLFFGLLSRRRQRGHEGLVCAMVTSHDGAVVAASLTVAPFHTLVTEGPAAVLEELAQGYARRHGALSGVTGPGEAPARFANAWQSCTGARLVRGPTDIVYALETLSAGLATLGRHRRADRQDRSLVVEWTNHFWAEAELPAVADVEERVDAALAAGAVHLWQRPDDRPVAMAWEVGATPRGGRIGCVFTTPDERGRGYGRAVTGALSAQLLARGCRFCFLHADAANPAANRVYTSLGYREVTRYDEVRFSP